VPLLALWKSSPEAVSQMNVEQIVSAAGDGLLKDGSACSSELREYLSDIPSPSLAGYIDHCLSTSFGKSGMVLQDLVNEIGRRLDYEVTNGRYQGVVGGIGFDGIWRSPEANDLVVEVKTTDAYRISLDTVAVYRSKLIEAKELSSNSSILIVVGREDTGELEAQIRGSRHAWDVRLISAEALLNLLQVRENSTDPAIGIKIRSLFAPVEYTRLDRMVDVVFTAVADTETPASVLRSAGIDISSTQEKVKSDWQFTDAALLRLKRAEVIEALARREGVALLAKSQAQYWTPDREFRAVCTLSKRYEGKNQLPYWYAYHPQWDDFLRDADRSFFVLGCIDRDQAFAIPRQALVPILPKLNQTVRDTGAYWHIHLAEGPKGLSIVVPNYPDAFPLADFALTLK